MSRIMKTILTVLFFAVVIIIGAGLVISVFWNDGFDVKRPREIGVYNSPNGEYELVFEQMGDPQWPFGPTDVRLTLKTDDGDVICRVDATLYNDGANAGEGNIVSVVWNDDDVTVILRAAEMEDKEVTLPYNGV